MNFAEIVKEINVTAVITVAAVVIGGFTLYYKLKSNQDRNLPQLKKNKMIKILSKLTLLMAQQTHPLMMMEL